MQNQQPYQDPILINSQEEEKTIKRQGNIIVYLVSGCLLFICIIIGAIAYYFYQNNYAGNNPPTNTDNSQITPSIESKKISDYSQIKFNTNYIQKVLPEGVTAYKRPQIDFLKKVFTLADQKQWTGNLSDPLGFSYLDFLDEYNNYVKEYTSYVKSKELSSDMQVQLLRSNSEKIKGYLVEGRQDFLTQINSMGFSQSYINEIEGYVLPNLPNRIDYLSDNYDNANYIGSATKSLSGDNSRKIIQIDPRDINYVYNDLQNTVFGKKLDNEGLIKASSKIVIYHEMGHVLMQAYINLHVPTAIKTLGDSDMWMYSNYDFLESGKDYYWAWPYNKQINDERIAQGLMIKILYLQYGLSEFEQNDFFDLVVGKDNYNMNTIHSLGELLDNQYDNLLLTNWGNLKEYLQASFIPSNSTVESTQLIKSMLDVTTKLPAYIGYFNPATDKDWQYFKKD